MMVNAVFAAGGVLYRNTASGLEVMLILRRGVWDLPKGGQEPGESLAQTAVREVSEELGTSAPELGAFLTETTHEYDWDDGKYIKRTAWYAMQPVSDQFEPQAEEAIEACKWVPIDDAMQKVAFDNLKIPLEALKKLF